MAQAYSSHRTSYVWLRSYYKVIGINLDELNNHIDYYNHVSGRWLTFWEYLTFEIEDIVYGFDVLWNDGNPLMSRVKTIFPCILEG